MKKYLVAALALCVLLNNEIFTLAVLCVIAAPLVVKLVAASAEVDK